MPFGIGHHLFFPLTPRTTLHAPAGAYWSEKEEYLPGERGTIPPELDFSTPRALPQRWINNGFEGWNRRARIVWPERDLGISIDAGEAFTTYFLFRSDTDFEPDFSADYFCFEPMTHLADGHHLPEYGGLVELAPGAALTSPVVIRPFPLS